MPLLTAPPLLEALKVLNPQVFSQYEPHQNTAQSMLQQLTVVEREIVLTT